MNFPTLEIKMKKQSYIPEGYKPTLDAYDTQRAIAFIKNTYALYAVPIENPKPYNSFGNGAAMRISAVAYVAETLEEVKRLSKLVTEVTHNHPEGIKGAQATAACIFLARTGKSKEEINTPRPQQSRGISNQDVPIFCSS